MRNEVLLLLVLVVGVFPSLALAFFPLLHFLYETLQSLEISMMLEISMLRFFLGKAVFLGDSTAVIHQPFPALVRDNGETERQHGRSRKGLPATEDSQGTSK